MTADELWNMLVNYAKDTNHFPSIKDFARYVRMQPQIIAKVYQRWLKEGKLTIKGNYYNFPTPIYNKSAVVKPKTVATPIKVNQSKLIKAITAIIGIVLVICSIHFTYNFNTMAMNKLWSFLMSFSTVTFMAFAFAIKSYMTKKTSKALVIFLWILGISYSVFTAVSGQYNDFRKYTANDNSVKTVKTEKLLTESKKRLIEKQKQLLHFREEERLYTENTDLKVENPSTWRNITKGVSELNAVEKDIADIDNKLLNNIESDTVENTTVYHWIGNIFGVSSDVIQFIIILFLATFIDVCSTVCINFSLGKE